jgi:hydroxyethylthiazole kinase-like uncharacterized protein yjeF
MAIDETLLVTPSAMSEIDAAAIAGGLDGYGLMRAAGAHVAACVLAHFPGIGRAIVLCGPGNNGGDGHVAARLLAANGIVTLRYGVPPKPGGDAARADADCPVPMLPLSEWRPQAGDVIVDALFGAGLDRPVNEEIAALMAQAAAALTPVVAVDLPSGLSGRTGRPTGACFQAVHTVTFAAMKPGHLLMPGSALCGEVWLCDIGIPLRLIGADDPIKRNNPELFEAALPSSNVQQHKYSRGHLAVFSGPLISGGAARLAAIAGLRAGVGLVTLGTPPGAVMMQAAHLTAVMQKALRDTDDLENWLEDGRVSGFVLGPGFGDLAKARAFVDLLARSGRPVVLDADGLSAFSGRIETLAQAFGGETRLVVTPHEGEFRRLFPNLADDDRLSKIDRARIAAAELNGVVIYKGPDTVIAAPDGRAAVNADAPPWLATAGSGDVLAGLAGSLLAQGMPVFEAACAAVAQHGRAGMNAGRSMTAEDLVDQVSPA